MRPCCPDQQNVLGGYVGCSSSTVGGVDTALF